MKAIQVKYLAPTNYQGSRTKAFISSGRHISFTHEWDYSLSDNENYAAAVAGLVKKLAWDWEQFNLFELPGGDLVATVCEREGGFQPNPIKYSVEKMTFPY